MEEPLEIGTFALGHSLVRSLVHALAGSLTRSQASGTVEYFCPMFKVNVQGESLWLARYFSRKLKVKKRKTRANVLILQN